MENEKIISEPQSEDEPKPFLERNQNQHALYVLDSPVNRKSEKGRTLTSLFGEVINIRGIHHELGMDESTVRALRKRYNDGGSVSVEKMREVLKAKGYKCVQEERWG